jgi:hypothetical protein
MSAQEEFNLNQRILNVLFQRGHMMTRFTIEYLLRQLNDHIERMISLNDDNERRHLDDQVLLLQHLNESNERIRNQAIINAQIQGQHQIQGQDQDQDQNMDTDMDEENSLSQQTELDQSFIMNPEPFTFTPTIYTRLSVSRGYQQRSERSKIIARRKLEQYCPSDCSICQEIPKYKDAVCTECNHYYCKGCWENWMNAEGSNKKCPTCRRDMPIVTIFKARAPNRRNVV